MWHIQRRRSYTVVHRTDDGVAIDDGNGFVVQGGHSAHAMFVSGLQKPNYFQNLLDGAGKATQRARESEKYSAALKRRLRAPPGEGAICGGGS